MNAPKSRRQQLLDEWGQLDAIYQSGWKTTHEEIGRYTQPGRSRFTQSDRNRGDRKDQSIVNDSAVMADKKLAAAMDTAVTSAAREWFRLSAANFDIPSSGQGSDYLHQVQGAGFDVLAHSNFYTAHRQLYRDFIAYGTSLLFIEEDEQDVVRFIHVPVGQYRLAVDARGRVNKVMRLFSMSVGQLVEMFGYDACSTNVQQAYDNDRHHDWIDVLHVVEKREVGGYGVRDQKNKPWASCWLEYSGVSSSTTQVAARMDPSLGFLRESGYDEQPFVAPRWDVVGEDAYGRDSPGWQALGDAKALQALVRGNAQAIALLRQPPMNKPASMANGSLLPGALNSVPDGHAKFEPSIRLDPATVTVGQDEVRRHEARIDRAYYADVLYIISADERAQPATAEEIRAKKDERLLQLGGAFSRLADEDLKPLINRVLAIMQRRGRIPPPPPEFHGHGAVALEFENILVAAAKTIGISGVERTIATAGNLAAVTQSRDAVEALDQDAIMRTVVDMLGVSPKVLRSEEDLAAIRQQRAQQQQAAAQGGAMTQAAPALKQLSETDPTKLQQLLQQFGPAAAAAGQGQGA